MCCIPQQIGVSFCSLVFSNHKDNSGNFFFHLLLLAVKGQTNVSESKLV